MKGKIFTLLLMLLFLTGCDATYNLEYTNNTFKESLTINNLSGFEEQVKSVYSFDLSTSYLDISDYTKEDGLAHGYKYYEKTLKEENGLSLNYKFEFQNDEYENTQIGRSAFPNMKYNGTNLVSGKINDIYVKYPDLENIIIEFKTDKFVIFNNADNIVDNKYYWYFTKENYAEKNIKISLTDEDNRDFVEKLKDETQHIEDSEYDTFFKYVFITIGVVLVIVILFVAIKFKNSNKK